jgi:hypothetical protein
MGWADPLALEGEHVKVVPLKYEHELYLMVHCGICGIRQSRQLMACGPR